MTSIYMSFSVSNMTKPSPFASGSKDLCETLFIDCILLIKT